MTDSFQGAELNHYIFVLGLKWLYNIDPIMAQRRQYHETILLVEYL